MPSRSFDAFPEQAAAIPVRRVGRGSAGLRHPAEGLQLLGHPERSGRSGRDPRGNGAQRGVGRSRDRGPAARRGDRHLSLSQVGHSTDGQGVRDGVLEQAPTGKSRRSASAAGCRSPRPACSWPTIRSRRSSTARTRWSPSDATGSPDALFRWPETCLIRFRVTCARRACALTGDKWCPPGRLMAADPLDFHGFSKESSRSAPSYCRGTETA